MTPPSTTAPLGKITSYAVSENSFRMTYKQTSINPNLNADEIALYNASILAQEKSFVYFAISNVQTIGRNNSTLSYGASGYFDRYGRYHSCFRGSPFYRGGYPLFTRDGFYASADCSYFDGSETISQPEISMTITGYQSQNATHNYYETATILKELGVKYQPKHPPSIK